MPATNSSATVGPATLGKLLSERRADLQLAVDAAREVKQQMAYGHPENADRIIAQLETLLESCSCTRPTKSSCRTLPTRCA